jgi:hypothetical protein
MTGEETHQAGGPADHAGVYVRGQASLTSRVPQGEDQGRREAADEVDRAMTCHECGRDDRETFDVAGRLIVFSYDKNWDRETISGLLEMLTPTATKLQEAGAIAVVLISDDVNVSTMDDQQLTEIGLQRVP